MSGRLFITAFALTFAVALALPRLSQDAMGGAEAPEGGQAMGEATANAAATAPALPPARYGATVEIDRSSDGHFWANVLLNGTTKRMLVDTGATSIALSEEDAHSIGINPLPSAFSDQATTASGVVQVARVHIATVRIGDIERADIPAVVIQGQQSIAPLFGQSFLRTIDNVSISGDKMVMR
ncbi:MAG: TIGR02281 family clan AA aspartic protease [Sphingopyxis sp.]